jgi:hypothetical protein
MRAVIVYDRQFEIAVERRGRYRLPLHEGSEPHDLQFRRDPNQNLKYTPAF